ncbi:hypothetical protein GBA52_028654 [Prunus armeniaca]|nr:hypothetical protein GBA52_028654 [Prunus armeniaca]
MTKKTRKAKKIMFKESLRLNLHRTPTVSASEGHQDQGTHIRLYQKSFLKRKEQLVLSIVS